MFDANEVFILLILELVEITLKKDSFPWSDYDKWGEKQHTWNVTRYTASILKENLLKNWMK